MKLLSGIVLLIGVLVGRLSFAATFYVATTGNDSNSCTGAQNSSTPKRNIIGARGGLSCLGAGNARCILDVRAGSYNDGITSVVSGTSFANAATIRAHSGETVTSRGHRAGGAFYRRFSMGLTSAIKISGLVLLQRLKMPATIYGF
jgi:hypothetical protein